MENKKAMEKQNASTAKAASKLPANPAPRAEMTPEEAELKGYCKQCRKAYPDGQLKTEVNISSDGWFEDYTLRCPKGHVIYFKD